MSIIFYSAAFLFYFGVGFVFGSPYEVMIVTACVRLSSTVVKHVRDFMFSSKSWLLHFDSYIGYKQQNAKSENGKRTPPPPPPQPIGFILTPRPPPLPLHVFGLHLPPTVSPQPIRLVLPPFPHTWGGGYCAPAMKMVHLVRGGVGVKNLLLWVTSEGP